MRISECLNGGDDIVSIAKAVGNDVYDCDHVAALHEPGAPFGPYAEYSIAYN